MYDDARRNALIEEVDKFIQEKLMNSSMESKVRCVVAITTLLKNAVELGQAQIAKDGVIQMMLVMANRGDVTTLDRASREDVTTLARANTGDRLTLSTFGTFVRSKQHHVNFIVANHGLNLEAGNCTHTAINAIE